MPHKGNMRKDVYTVIVELDEATGALLSQKWMTAVGPSAGTNHPRMDYHREDGPADIRIEPRTGIVTWETWYRNGRVHRVGGPAELARHPLTGIVTSEQWYEHAILHRQDGPAVTYRHAETGKVTYTMWFKEGNLIPWDRRHKRDVSDLTIAQQRPEPL